MNTMKITSVALSLFALAFAGCASFDRQTEQEVAVSSRPSGATVYLGEEKVGVTPTSLVLKRDTNYSLRVELKDYQPFTTELVPAPVPNARADSPRMQFPSSVNVMLQEPEPAKSYVDFSSQMMAIVSARKEGRISEAEYKTERDALIREYSSQAKAPAGE